MGGCLAYPRIYIPCTASSKWRLARIFPSLPYPHACIPYRSIFGAPLTTGGGDSTYSPATATLAPKTRTETSNEGHVEVASQPSALALAAELHAAVEQGDAEAVLRVLSSRQQLDGDATEVGGDDAKIGQTQPIGPKLPLPVDCACPRTGLTPLLKAVEGGSEDVVRVLLEAGGDVQSKVSDKMGSTR